LEKRGGLELQPGEKHTVRARTAVVALRSKQAHQVVVECGRVDYRKDDVAAPCTAADCALQGRHAPRATRPTCGFDNAIVGSVLQGLVLLVEQMEDGLASCEVQRRNKCEK
jgi:hypothetical protein